MLYNYQRNDFCSQPNQGPQSGQKPTRGRKEGGELISRLEEGSSNEHRLAGRTEGVFQSAPIAQARHLRDGNVMGSNDEGDRTPSAHLVEMVVRTLRHEIGDLLQSVYSAVAILQERLPKGQGLERTILGDLRARAETCKNELDATHDLVCPLSLNLDWVELSELASNIAAAFSLRFPGLQIVCDAARPVKVWADGQRLAQAGQLLMMALCQAARSKIETRVALSPAKNAAEWTFRHDGPVPTAEQLSWLTAPFSTTRHAHFGLGLAFARRIVELQGGRVAAAAEPGEGGFRISLVLPPDPTPGSNNGME
jgi:signal transduction histidine kinase